MGVKAFEALLQRVEEADRGSLSGLAVKYPFLQEAVATQDELAGLKTHFAAEKSDLTNKFAALNTQFEESSKKLQGWKEWREKSWDEQAGMTKAEKFLRTQLAEVERENDILRDASGGEVTLDQLDKYFAQKSASGDILTKQALEGQLGRFVDRDTYGKDVQARLGAAAGMVGDFLATAMPLYLEHQKEFGEILDLNKLVELAQTSYGGDINAAHRAMVDPRRVERTTKERQEEIAAAEKRGFEKASQQRAMSIEGAMPTDLSGAAPMGHLQARMSGGEPGKEGGDKVAAVLEKSNMGDMSLARMAAAEAVQMGSGAKE